MIVSYCRNMSAKFSIFFSSFGIMLAGVFLLFASTVSFSAPRRDFIPFPASGARIKGGGDIIVGDLPVSKPAVPLLKDKSQYSGSSTAVSTIVVDTDTKTILHSKNKVEVRPIASITKLMSAMVLLDLPLNWTSTTIIVAADWDGSDHHLNVGEKFTLEDLWHVALIGSSNTAINALVRASGLTMDQFVEKMNQKAKELRIFSAHFVEPTGLSEKNVANAWDVAKLLIDALRFDKIYSTLQIGEYYTHPLAGAKPRRVWTTNWLLTDWIPNKFKMENVIGKTGYISNAGYNFAVNLTGDSKHTVTVVVLGASSNEQRFSEARDLAEWALAHYLWPDDNGYQDLAE